MLSSEEKAYCRALEALRKKDYITADIEFDAAIQLYRESSGFRIMAQAAKILAELEQREKQLQITKETIIEETVTHGEETVIRRQGFQEKTRSSLPDLQF